MRDRLDEAGWATLDREHPGEPFTVRVDGRVLHFRPAADVPAKLLVRVSSEWRLFLGYMVVNSDDLVVADFPQWKAEHMLWLWRRHSGLCMTSRDDLRLLNLLEQPDYRDAIESDLQEVHGLDLGTEWRARRWRKLLNLVDRLRRNTHFGEAVSLDEELARFLLGRESKNGALKLPGERRMAEFTVEAELLSLAVDRLGELLQLQVAQKGGSGRRVKPQPRPQTALSRLREQRDLKHVDFTLDRIFGRVDENGNPTVKGAGPPTS